MAAAQDEIPSSDLRSEPSAKKESDPDRVATSLIVAGVVFLLLAIADTVAVRGFGLGTLWGSVMGAAFLTWAFLIWKRRPANAG